MSVKVRFHIGLWFLSTSLLRWNLNCPISRNLELEYQAGVSPRPEYSPNCVWFEIGVPTIT